MDRVAVDGLSVVGVVAAAIALESGSRLLTYDDDDDDDSERKKDRSIGGGLMTYLGPLTLRINMT